MCGSGSTVVVAQAAAGREQATRLKSLPLQQSPEAEDRGRAGNALQVCPERLALGPWYSASFRFARFIGSDHASGARGTPSGATLAFLRWSILLKSPFVISAQKRALPTLKSKP